MRLDIYVDLSLHLHPYFVFEAVKALATDSPEPLLLDRTSTKISCAGSFMFFDIVI